MPTTPLVLALCAAFVHAGWNLLLSRARDSKAATAVALAAGALGFAPGGDGALDVSARGGRAGLRAGGRRRLGAQRQGAPVRRRIGRARAPLPRPPSARVSGG